MATLIELQQQIEDLTRMVDKMRRDAVPQPVRRPVGIGSAGGFTEYGVVRDIGDGNDDFVMVQKLKHIGTSPKWEFPEAEGVQVAAVKIDTWAGVASSEFAIFLSSASGTWSAGFTAPVIAIFPTALSSVAVPWCPEETVDPADIVQVPQTDAFPPTPT